MMRSMVDRMIITTDRVDQMIIIAHQAHNAVLITTVDRMIITTDRVDQMIIIAHQAHNAVLITTVDQIIRQQLVVVQITMTN